MPEWLNEIAFGKATWLDLFAAILILIFALVLARVLTAQLRRTLKEKMSRENLELLVKVLSYGVMVVALLWILSTVGVELSGLLVAGGIFGLALGFASQSIIGNLVSGLFLMGERPFKVGDLVEVSGDMGVVEDIRIISTTIRTLEGTIIRVPNESVFTGSITNYTSNPVRRFEYSVGISYADDAGKAIEIIRGIIREHPLALVNPAPQVYVGELGDNSVDITVRVWAPSSEWFGVKMELLWQFKEGLDEAGIEIPFPQRVLWFGREEEAQKSSLAGN